jgi:hypothetical protein
MKTFDSFINSNVGAGIVTAGAVGLVAYIAYKMYGVPEPVKRVAAAANTAVTGVTSTGQDVANSTGILDALQAIFKVGKYDNMTGSKSEPSVSDAPYRVEGTTGTGKSMIPDFATSGIVPEYIPIYSAPENSTVLGDVGDGGARAL